MSESDEAQGAAAAKAFGVVAAEGDTVSTKEIGLALKRLAERVAGADKALQGPAVKLVRKEWQYLAKLGSRKERSGFVDLLVKQGLDSTAGKSLISGMRKTLDTETMSSSTTPAGSTGITPASQSTPLSNGHESWLDVVKPSNSKAAPTTQGPAPPTLEE